MASPSQSNAVIPASLIAKNVENRQRSELFKIRVLNGKRRSDAGEHLRKSSRGS